MRTISIKQKLQMGAQHVGNIACMGLDPIVQYLPKKYRTQGIRGFIYYLQELYTELDRRGVAPAAFKPNDAYYAAHNNFFTRSFLGYRALAEIMSTLHDNYPESTRIFDVKREDIGTTAERYAVTCFEGTNADAITVGIYPGSDCLHPYGPYCQKGKGIYVLARMSNPSAAQLQDIAVGSFNVAFKSIDIIVDVYKQYGGIGAVIGATSPDSLRQIVDYLVTQKQVMIPLLIPGVGSQGGSARDVIEILDSVGYDKQIVRINSSSALTHSWKSEDTPSNYLTVCADAIESFCEACAIGNSPLEVSSGFFL